MEKNYDERILAMKQEILADIVSAMGVRKKIEFATPIDIYYIDDKGVMFLELWGIAINEKNEVLFQTDETKYVQNLSSFLPQDDLQNIDANSLSSALMKLREEIRTQSFSNLKKLLKKVGDQITFDGKFLFGVKGDGTECDAYLKELVSSDGIILMTTETDGETFVDTVEIISDSEIERFVEYVEEKVSEKYYITKEQNEAIDAVAKAVKKAKELGLSIAFNKINGELCFINSDGKDIVTTTIEPENNLLEYGQYYDCIDIEFDPSYEYLSFAE